MHKLCSIGEHPMEYYMTTIQTLPVVSLPYAMSDLMPSLSARSVEFHYEKHYKSYISLINELVAGTPLEGRNLIYMLRNATTGLLLNNVGMAYNHELFFTQFSPHVSSHIVPPLFRKIVERNFGSFDRMIVKMTEMTQQLFGSGWTWLYTDSGGKLLVGNFPNGENPWLYGMIPLLGIDMWEHAYYLDYQNRKSEYVKSFWAIVDWTKVAERYEMRSTT